jgi:hypothetical protein
MEYKSNHGNMLIKKHMLNGHPNDFAKYKVKSQLMNVRLGEVGTIMSSHKR